MREVISVDPFRCRIWEAHGRLEEYITEESCHAEIESFTAHGQLFPVLVRNISGDPAHEFEVVCGARRLFVARHLNIPLQVEVRDLSDREAVVALEIENCRRKDVSAYERGKCFARWLTNAYFESQDDIARTLRVSPSQVSRLLKIGRLPSVIIDAFSSPGDICETWGLELYTAWESQRNRSHIAAAARQLAKKQPRLSPDDAYSQLMTCAQSKGQRIVRSRDEVVVNSNGQALFRIKHQRRSVALVIGTDKMSMQSFNKIKEAIIALLQDTSLHGIEKNGTLSAATSDSELADIPEQDVRRYNAKANGHSVHSHQQTL